MKVRFMTVEQKRYKDLQNYFSDKEIAKAVLENGKEFHDWLERIKWSVRKCDELARELEAYKKALEDIKGEIADTDFDMGDYYDHTDEIQKRVLTIVDKHTPKTEEK